jgi:hypothetical protein
MRDAVLDLIWQSSGNRAGKRSPDGGAVLGHGERQICEGFGRIECPRPTARDLLDCIAYVLEPPRRRGCAPKDGPRGIRGERAELALAAAIRDRLGAFAHQYLQPADPAGTYEPV